MFNYKNPFNSESFPGLNRLLIIYSKFLDKPEKEIKNEFKIFGDLGNIIEKNFNQINDNENLNKEISDIVNFFKEFDLIKGEKAFEKQESQILDFLKTFQSKIEIKYFSRMLQVIYNIKIYSKNLIY